ncbi:hypothetical protein [Mycolicibacterium aubagnense]|uniref:Integrase n=1 Tax=Mycolicibacterium aubagnense TaxID=319707 RepID=A0ABM7ING2_9MYCO|nr:hypothetical protein [Mycolicibacterium aubagnense]BBX88350.1 hypothetical protein MAUB_65510 [Mycolicibacterium aubagnense]
MLADLAAGRRALTHEALDELPHSQPLAHLRHVLIGVGALPRRDEHMVRIERFIDQTLAAHANLEQRQALHRYTVWHLIRRLRQRNNGHAITIQQFNSVRQRTHAAIAFLDWLTEHQLTLGSCQQADLDRWLTDAAATHRGAAGHFIRWAHKNKLTSVRIGAHRWMGPPDRSMTRTAGTSRAACCTTTASSPMTGWPACSFSLRADTGCDLPNDHRRYRTRR